MMLSFVAHRGPDDSGKFIGSQFGIGHARLSIIDLSGGKQPFLNEDHSIIVAGNHEIYNFRELRKELEGYGHSFRTQSDTEVIMYAYEHWGTECFIRFRGMFAVAIVDTKKQKCILGRDHIGIKPIVYAEYQGGYVFSSEAKPILSLDGFRRQMDRKAFHLFMNFRYIPTDDTLFEGIKKIPPGTYAEIESHGRIKMNRFYSVFEHFKPMQWQCREDALCALKDTFEKSVERHLVSDVPVGTYLSV
jgi:asparagine synthase (glutamine-hydrolysing)